MENLRQYQCFKRVWALRIEIVTFNAQGALLEGDGRQVFVDHTYVQNYISPLMVKGVPLEGSYYVRYEDGSKSFMSSKRFEADFALIEEELSERPEYNSAGPDYPDNGGWTPGVATSL